MSFIADLHIHSHFSRATAKNLNPENLALWAQKKGISVIGTGDFTHPGWLSEIKEKLVDAGNGLYILNHELAETIRKDVPVSCRGEPKFLLSGEISCIYKKGDKTRKVHHLILMPDVESVERLNKKLDQIGNITSDGRPILGLDSRDLLEMTLEASDKAFFIPAHIWTPWFSVFGSKSGFDTLEECFEDLTPHIHALETGLSSDPPMNRLLSGLDDYLLVSNSDAHSPAKLGREANIFDVEMDYEHMTQAMVTKQGFLGTIEFYPEEGKYHLDGHRKCGVRMEPIDTLKNNKICPSCGKPVTVGVLHRVVELSDREKPILAKEFSSLIPLPEILSEILGVGPATKSVSTAYEEMLNNLGPELNILMNVSVDEIKNTGGILVAEAIERMREGRVIREEGYDGEFGIIHLFHDDEKAELEGQTVLFKRPKKKSKKRKGSSIRMVSKNKQIKTNQVDQNPVSDPIIDVLNKAQKEAVTYTKGHLQIVAGPGTGKTMTLSHRIAYMILSCHIVPEQILALTFTNKASKEMRKRINDLLPEDLADKVNVNTFHGFCLGILREEAEHLNIQRYFSLCSEYDTIQIARNVAEGLGKGRRFSTKLLNNIRSLKKSYLFKENSELVDEEMSKAYKEYEKKIRDMGMLDLDDLELLTLKLFKEHPEICLKYAERFLKILIDEYQDTNPTQSRILKEIIYQGKGEVCAIGDPDQAIYGFRGADVENFSRFQDDFPGSRNIILKRNYRSTQVILDGASQILGNDTSLIGMAGPGDPILIAPSSSHTGEAEMVVEQIEKLIGGTSHFSLDSGRVSSQEGSEDIGFGDIAVLFRINAQGDSFEEAFSRAGIPYSRSGEKPLIDQYPTNVIWRFLQAFLYGESVYYLECYKRIIKEKKLRYNYNISEIQEEYPLKELIDRTIRFHDFDLSTDKSIKAVDRLREVADSFDGDLKSFLDALSIDRGIDHSNLLGDRVALMSLHAAKGLEWPLVFITGCEDKLIPCSLFGDSDISEEKRLLYVGMTRARKKLVLSYSRKRRLNGRVFEMKQSPFLGLISKGKTTVMNEIEWKSKAKSHKQLELF